MSAENGSSKADTLVKVVLVFFISLLSFSVGTFVGKQVSDSDHRRMALEGEYKVDRQVASADGKESVSADKISEKEVESLTEEFVNKEKSTATEAAAEEIEAEKAGGTAEKAEPTGYKSYSRTKVADAKGEPAPKNEPAKKGGNKPAPKGGKEVAEDATHGIAEKVAKGEAPSDGAKEERKPASTLPSVASSAVGKYTVQVGSYPDENQAKTTAAELKEKGWSAFYFPANVQGHTWYRVSVGLFTDFASATKFRAQFMKESNAKSALVQKIVQ